MEFLTDVQPIVAIVIGVVAIVASFGLGVIVGRRGRASAGEELVAEAKGLQERPPGTEQATGTARAPASSPDQAPAIAGEPGSQVVAAQAAVEEAAAEAAAVEEAAAEAADVEEAPADEAAVAEAAPGEEAWPLGPMARFRARLSRSRESFGSGLAALFRSGLDEQVYEELEERLIAADVGVEAATVIVDGLRQRAREQHLSDPDEVLALLKELLRLELTVTDRTLARRDDGPTTWLVTGVNGTGKTTSIGKLAARATRGGEKVVIAAADTFRAAAIEQLSAWGERANARVVKQAEGADPAAVAYDGWQAASANDAELLIVDTAGRLQNKRALMDELAKVKRVLEKGAGATDEVLLVLDATTGQNGLSQAQAFTEAVDVSGVVLTKLDGTARGGIVIAIQRQLGLPVKLVGLGEELDDLAEFDPDAFVEALFADVAQDVDLEES
ncbi:MAG: signal recognition particle-docking protein FtsY [Actinobacteria bacterium QS_8_72_14]|nr:MAG: signal recognition particle-docking protein FtsY [Actinobacteria bacterium QS_8_72_14]